MSNDQILAAQLFVLLNEVTKVLSLEDIKNIREFIEKREWGLAYETLCVQVYEYNIPITIKFYETISSLGKSIGISSAIWLPLKELIIEKNG